jgi:hypothetical protein
MVTSITVTFSDVVTLGPGAFILTSQSGGTVGLNVSSSVVNGQTVEVLTFFGPDIVGGSLADGRYALTTAGAAIRDSNGLAVDAAGTGQSGSTRTDALFRLFGDYYGTGSVDGRDYALFRAAYGKQSGQAGYLWFFDFNANGAIDRTDYTAFMANYGRSL